MKTGEPRRRESAKFSRRNWNADVVHRSSKPFCIPSHDLRGFAVPPIPPRMALKDKASVEQPDEMARDKFSIRRNHTFSPGCGSFIIPTHADGWPTCG